MRTIVNRKINLSDFNEEETILKGNIGSVMYIQLDGSNGDTIAVTGKHITADNTVTISGINHNGFTVTPAISENGLYSFDISGLDIIEFNISASEDSEAIIYVKVVE